LRKLLLLLHLRQRLHESKLGNHVSRFIVHQEEWSVHASTKQDLDVDLLFQILLLHQWYDHLVCRLRGMHDEGATIWEEAVREENYTSDDPA
jgi:hypothetical protein